MVQKRNTIREQILAALAEGPLSSKEIAEKINSNMDSIKHIRGDLVKKGQIEEVGYKFADGSFGNIKVWGLVKQQKVVAKNAFDWRNWETKCHQNKREIAYSNSLFNSKSEKRLIVYSRA